MQEQRIHDIEEVLQYLQQSDKFGSGISCFALDYDQMKRTPMLPSYTKSDQYIYILSGTAEAVVNFKSYEVKEGDLIMLSIAHLFHMCKFSKDFKAVYLFVSQEFQKEIASTDRIMRSTVSVQRQVSPVISVPVELRDSVTGSLRHINRKIRDTGHSFQKAAILNALVGFFIETANLVEKVSPCDNGNDHVHRNDVIFKSFIELAITHFKKEHWTPFYAEKLNITPQYLTSIVKELSGETVVQFIGDLLYSEAKLQLNNPDTSILQIACDLYFSDASAFVKFFKKKAGITPKDYRSRASFQSMAFNI